MKASKEFYLEFKDKHYKKGDAFFVMGDMYIVTKEPGFTWSRFFLRLITLGVYQYPKNYKVKYLGSYNKYGRKRSSYVR